MPDSGHLEFPRAQDVSATPTTSPSSRPVDTPARTLWIWAICGFLVLAVGLIYGQTLGHQFIAYDDQEFVYENPHVIPGLTLPGIWWALTNGAFGDWYPVTSLSHMLDCQIYGLNPTGHHLTNVLLHAASSVLLFLVLLRMTGVLWPSAWVAAVFAVHPLHVESVAWVAERRDMLSGLFFMLTLGAYTLYAERPSLARYLAVAGLFALGLMSKPMLITVPCVLLLLDYWPLGRFRRADHESSPATSLSWFGHLPIGCRLVIEKLPLLVLVALDTAIVVSTHASLRLTNAVDQRFSLPTRLANAAVSYAAYLGQSFLPVNMVPFYPHLGTRLPIAWVVASLAVLLAISAVAVYCWRRRPYLLVGWLWFLGMLVPVIGLVQFGDHARADRYTYLSQIGLSIALAWTVWSVYRSRTSIDAAPWRRWTLAGVSGGAVLALAAVACLQTSYWRNAETLWTHTLACSDQNRIAHSNLVAICLDNGQTAEAINHLRQALATDLADPEVIAMYHLMLADILNEHGQSDEALTHYQQTVLLYPPGELGHVRFALALAAAGQYDRAVAEWRESLRLVPTNLVSRIGLADALLAQGRASDAAAESREVLAQAPDAAEAIVILAMALVAEGKAEQAIPRFERALSLDPRNVRAHFRLGMALYDRGDSESALAHLNAAIDLKPDDVAMLLPVAWILATSPDAQARDGLRAVNLAKRAIQHFKDRDSHALDVLAAALAENSEFAAAVDVAEQASTSALIHDDAALADAIGQRISLYRQGLPYRQPPPVRPAGAAPDEDE